MADLTDDEIWQAVEQEGAYAKLYPAEEWSVPKPTAAKGHMPLPGHRTVAEVDQSQRIRRI